MKTCILLLLALMTGCCGRKPTPKGSDASLAMHHVVMESAADSVSCTGEAVGRRTILTAAHCVIGDNRITVDDEIYNIVLVLYDRNDHVLFVLDSANFSQYLALDQRSPIDHHVRLWGNPGKSRNVYREGWFEKAKLFEDADDAEDRMLYRFLLPIYPGDSGSGLISDEGKIISVISYGNENAEASVFRLNFSPAQLQQIQ